MSLLEDIFLQDEANEAQELERIIEGDEYDERPRNDYNSDENSEKEDEAEEDKRKVDPASTKTKRVTKNPRFVLNPARLTGPRGIQVIPDHFKDFKFKGKGHEKEDLDLVLKKLEHWAYRLYPKFQFEDCLKKIETLGKKRPVMVHLHKIRSDQFLSEETVVQKDSSDDEAPAPPEEDEFDKLLQQQIELAHASTPGPGSVKKPAVSTPMMDSRPSLTMPKATSSPSISEEQRERIMRNKKLAEERRLARLKAANNTNSPIDVTVPTLDNTHNGRSDTDVTYNPTDTRNDTDRNDSTDTTNDTKAKKNRSQVIDSSDDESDVPITAVNQTATADVHKKIDENIIDITEGYVHKVHIATNEIIDIDEEIERKKPNRSNVIDSSDDDTDEECNVTTVNESITVDIHDNGRNDDFGKTTDNETNNIDNVPDIENDAMQIVDVEPEISNNIDEVTDINSKDDNIENTHVIENDCKEVESQGDVNKKSDGIEETVHKIADTNNETLDNKRISEKLDEPELNEENIDNNKDSELVLDDIMDVDFTDDF